MVSLPIEPVGGLQSILDQIPWGRAMAFVRDGGRGRLRRVTEASVGQGFMLYSREATKVSYLGTPVAQGDAALEPGWHLLGPINDDEVSDGQTVLGMNERKRRERVTRRQRGQAYWQYVYPE